MLCETPVYLEHCPVVLQDLLLHLHQLRYSFMESEELWGHLFLLVKSKSEKNH